MAYRIRNAALGLLAGLFCCQCRPAVEAPPAAALPSPQGQVAAGPIVSLSPTLDTAPEKIALGRMLFHEPALSDSSRRLSCASCHPLEQGGATAVWPAEAPVAEGGVYNIPTVYNTAGQFAYFWNGRVQTLEGVVESSIRSEQVMNGSWPEIIQALTGNSDYRDRFSAVYPEAGITEATIEDALARFLESLRTPNAPFDDFLRGEPLEQRAREGYELFQQLGCVRCHQGADAGDNLYASFASYLESREPARSLDLGRFNITGDEAHRHQFKVPGLRAASATAPYFHDGSAATLEEAVTLMGRHQLGLELSPDETALIVAFIRSLADSGAADPPVEVSP